MLVSVRACLGCVLAAAALVDGAADSPEVCQNGRTVRIVDARFRPPSDSRDGRRRRRPRMERFLVRNERGVFVETARGPRMAREWIEERRRPEREIAILTGHARADGNWIFAEPFEGRIQLPPGTIAGRDPRGGPVEIDVTIRELVASLEIGSSVEPVDEVRITAGMSRELVLRVRSVRTGETVDWDSEYYLQIEGENAGAVTFPDGRSERTIVFSAGSARLTLAASKGGATNAVLVGFDPSLFNPASRPGARSSDDPVSPLRVPLRRTPHR